MSVQCEIIAEELSALAEGSEPATPETRAHVDRCLACQAEVVRYTKMLRALHDLRTEVLAPNPGLVTDILIRLEEAGERRAIASLLRGRRAAYVGGIAAATAAAGGAAALVLARRGTLRRAI